MKPYLILALATALIGQPTATQAADIYLAGMRWTGIPAVWIDGGSSLAMTASLLPWRRASPMAH
jgi:hypothetical protein